MKQLCETLKLSFVEIRNHHMPLLEVIIISVDHQLQVDHPFSHHMIKALFWKRFFSFF